MGPGDDIVVPWEGAEVVEDRIKFGVVRLDVLSVSGLHGIDPPMGGTGDIERRFNVLDAIHGKALFRAPQILRGDSFATVAAEVDVGPESVATGVKEQFGMRVHEKPERMPGGISHVVYERIDQLFELLVERPHADDAVGVGDEDADDVGESGMRECAPVRVHRRFRVSNRELCRGYLFSGGVQIGAHLKRLRVGLRVQARLPLITAEFVSQAADLHFSVIEVFVPSVHFAPRPLEQLEQRSDKVERFGGGFGDGEGLGVLGHMRPPCRLRRGGTLATPSFCYTYYTTFRC